MSGMFLNIGVLLFVALVLSVGAYVLVTRTPQTGTGTAAVGAAEARAAGAPAQGLASCTECLSSGMAWNRASGECLKLGCKSVDCVNSVAQCPDNSSPSPSSSPTPGVICKLAGSTAGKYSNQMIRCYTAAPIPSTPLPPGTPDLSCTAGGKGQQNLFRCFTPTPISTPVVPENMTPTPTDVADGSENDG